MKILLIAREIRSLLDMDSRDFPKFVSLVIDLAKQYVQGTRPRVVGQMSELLREFDGRMGALVSGQETRSHPRSHRKDSEDSRTLSRLNGPY